MNEKGFAATGILYTILVMFIMFFTGMIMMLSSRNNILINLQKEVKDKIQNSVYDVVLKANEVEYVKDVVDGENIIFEVTDADKENATNIYCNNGAEPMLDGNNVVISNAISGTVCAISPSLLTTVNSLDQTKNNIVMISDESFSTDVILNENTNVLLNLNTKQLSFVGKSLKTKGDLIINGDENSIISNSLTSLINNGSGKLTINGGKYIRTNAQSSANNTIVYNFGLGTIEINGGTFDNQLNSGPCVQNSTTSNTDGGGTIIINGGTFSGNNRAIVNNATSGGIIINGGNINSLTGNSVNNVSTGTININGGIITSDAGNTVYNQGAGTINIKQTTNPIYITTLSQVLKPAVLNSTTGIINISGNSANQCTPDSTKTTSGLCVYAEGNKSYNSDTANYAVANNGSGIINVNGGTYYGGYVGISNHNDGTVNILNGNIISGKYAVYNIRVGPINICNATISASKDVSSIYDLWINSNSATTATINYSSKVIFSNGTNTPKTGGLTSSIIPNYTGTCSS